MSLYGDAASSAPGSLNVGPWSMYATPGDHHWQEMRWYEAPRGDPAWHEVHLYTDAMSYAPGDAVSSRASTNAPTWSLTVLRDGLHPAVVHRAENLPGQAFPTPRDAHRTGCGWPEAHRWTLPDDLPSGFYVVESRCARAQGGAFVQHHFFVVRPTAATRRGRLLHILPTGTYTAYND